LDGNGDDDSVENLSEIRDPRKKRKMTNEEKLKIVVLDEQKMSARQIARNMGFDHRNISRFLKRYNQTKCIERQPGPDRKRKLKPRDERRVVQEVVKDRFISIAKIRRELELDHVSNWTIGRVIKRETGMQSCFALNKPFISDKNRKRRLEWCEIHKDWTFDQWKRVIFSDESPYTLRIRCRRRCWRKPGERYKNACLRKTVKHDQKVMVWGCFAAHGVGIITWIKGIMRKEHYEDILNDSMIPSANLLFGDDNFIFQQDNDPKHTANTIKEWFTDRNVEVLAWPSQSPDLNPIENLWGILDKRLAGRTCNSEEELFKVLEEGWNALPVDLLTRLVESMPRRIQAVIDAKGDATKY
jgi:transposase